MDLGPGAPGSRHPWFREMSRPNGSEAMFPWKRGLRATCNGCSSGFAGGHICLHWCGFWGQCRQIWHTWSVWGWHVPKISARPEVEDRCSVFLRTRLTNKKMAWSSKGRRLSNERSRGCQRVLSKKLFILLFMFSPWSDTQSSKNTVKQCKTCTVAVEVSPKNMLCVAWFSGSGRSWRPDADQLSHRLCWVWEEIAEEENLPIVCLTLFDCRTGKAWAHSSD